MTLSDSFRRVQKWIEELKAFNKNTVLAIAGNKIDLSHKAEVETADILAYAKEENARLFYTSAKTGEGLDDIFNHITNEITKREQEKTQDQIVSNGKTTKKLMINRSNSANNNEKEKGCC